MKQIKLKDNIINYEVIKHTKRYVSFKYKDNILYIYSNYIDDKFINDLFLKHSKMILNIINRSKNNKKIDLSNGSIIKLIGEDYKIIYSDSTYINDHIIYLDSKNIIKDISKIFLDKLDSYCSYYTSLYCSSMYDNIKCPSIIYKNTKTYSGQYNKKYHQITFNIALVLQDPKYIDYVIVHELAHIKYMNHGKEFHALIEKYIPNSNKILKELKERWIGLYGRN